MDIKSSFQQTNRIYLALLGGQMFFAAIIFFVLGTNENPVDTGLGLALPFVMLGGMGAGYWIYNQRAIQGASLSSVSEKIMHYRVSNIIRLAMTEGPNLLALVMVLLEGQTSYWLYFAAGILAFLYFRPSKDKFFSDYQLSASEQQEFHAALS